MFFAMLGDLNLGIIRVENSLFLLLSIPKGHIKAPRVQYPDRVPTVPDPGRERICERIGLDRKFIN
jgi:hypothetical protein